MTLNHFPTSLVERLVAFAETAGVTIGSITWQNVMDRMEVELDSGYDLGRLLAVLEASGVRRRDERIIGTPPGTRRVVELVLDNFEVEVVA